MKINFIDNGDSFADTIAAYFAVAGADVRMLRSNCSLDTAMSGEPDLMLLGPGPNGPKDAGNYMELLDKYHRELPFFGICLGFQAMMEYFGQPVVRLDDVVHGGRVPVKHNGKGIFEGIQPEAQFARYNSLGVYDVPDCFEKTATSPGVVGPVTKYRFLGGNRITPDEYTERVTTKDIVMAARHKTLPIEGIQFHPESVLSMTNENGMKLVSNVLKYLPK